MKFLKENSHTILVAALCILGTILIMNTCSPTRVSEKAIRAQVEREQLEKQRIIDSIHTAEVIALKDEQIAILKDRDTVLVTRYKTTQNAYNNIKPTVDRLNDDELARAVEAFR